MNERDYFIKGYNNLIKRAKETIFVNVIVSLLSTIASLIILFGTDAIFLSLLFIVPFLRSIFVISEERRNIEEYKKELKKYEEIC